MSFFLFIEKRFSALENIQVMLSRINDAKSDGHVIDAYKMGTNTLRNIFTDSGITLDTVDDTLSEVQEVLELQDEIQATIGGPVVVTSTAEDQELEQELAELMEAAGDDVVIPTIEKSDLDTLEKRLEALSTSFGPLSTSEDEKEKSLKDTIVS